MSECGRAVERVPLFCYAYISDQQIVRSPLPFSPNIMYTLNHLLLRVAILGVVLRRGVKTCARRARHPVAPLSVPGGERFFSAEEGRTTGLVCLGGEPPPPLAAGSPPPPPLPRLSGACLLPLSLRFFLPYLSLLRLLSLHLVCVKGHYS